MKKNKEIELIILFVKNRKKQYKQEKSINISINMKYNY